MNSKTPVPSGTAIMTIDAEPSPMDIWVARLLQKLVLQIQFALEETPEGIPEVLGVEFTMGDLRVSLQIEISVRQEDHEQRTDTS